MKIVVFGASRGVGRSLIEQGLSSGYEVTAAVRTAAAVPLKHPRLRVLTCDVLDPDAVEGATAGQDVAFATLGTATKGPTNLYSTGAANIARAMRIHHVRRLVFLSNFGVLGERAEDLRGATLLFLARRMIRHTLADHRRALELIGQAPEWIAVRPMPLTHGPATGRYRVAVEGIPIRGVKIARADVAHFMLNHAAAGDAYVNKAPALAY